MLKLKNQFKFICICLFFLIFMNNNKILGMNNEHFPESNDDSSKNNHNIMEELNDHRILLALSLEQGLLGIQMSNNPSEEEILSIQNRFQEIRQQIIIICQRRLQRTEQKLIQKPKNKDNGNISR
ncbi:MAG: hypothetical protein Q2306_01140 [Phytoplasma sp.]|uniref:hypothetical protein n=1 Tax=Phytoplasma sp. TaxID=2155 RepID=UPI002B40FAFE|nr:hypothetical protein [Phytoplasma sp.]WRH06930.1 MAG: hypothetical protein Q2306_01140 [Phytoplasma sp.]